MPPPSLKRIAFSALGLRMSECHQMWFTQQTQVPWLYLSGRHIENLQRFFLKKEKSGISGLLASYTATDGTYL